MSSFLPQHQILGVGAAIADHILCISEEDLKTLPGRKGGMECIDFDTLQSIIRNFDCEAAFVPGGSCANVIRGLSHLGHSCALVGKVGRDPIGDKIINSLSKLGIKTFYSYAKAATSQVVCLVTPDGQRTCRSYLGATCEMEGSHLDKRHFQDTSVVHIEGYALLNNDLVSKAVEYTNASGAVLSFDLSSFEIVERYRQTILELVKNSVNILFANSEEATALTGLPAQEACAYLHQFCQIAVISMNIKGCWVGWQKELIHCPAYVVEPLDSTGAGDLFACGFLHGYLKGKNGATCAHYGALLGAAVVQVYGAELPEDVWQTMRHQMNS